MTASLRRGSGLGGRQIRLSTVAHAQLSAPREVFAFDFYADDLGQPRAGWQTFEACPRATPRRSAPPRVPGGAAGRGRADGGAGAGAEQIHRAGTVHGVAFWFTLHLDGATALSTAPGNRTTCWKQAVQLFPEPLEVAAGDRLPLWCSHDQTRIAFAAQPPGPDEE